MKCAPLCTLHMGTLRCLRRSNPPGQSDASEGAHAWQVSRCELTPRWARIPSLGLHRATCTPFVLRALPLCYVHFPFATCALLGVVPSLGLLCHAWLATITCPVARSAPRTVLEGQHVTPCCCHICLTQMDCTLANCSQAAPCPSRSLADCGRG